MGGLASKKTYDFGKNAKSPAANEEGPIKPVVSSSIVCLKWNSLLILYEMLLSL